MEQNIRLDVNHMMADMLGGVVLTVAGLVKELIKK